ncbi:hypothetical protein [Rhodoferax sp.]|uniref:hypothetical protein n=1 Tax=Rhodoferax sp. TaxID=50421 RepID=UPI00284D39BD|nr:hypothetical protein [Rhodoferax sp.]MDR3370820.1 hypothetical protein [Rhodoferax sp.]
MEVSSTRTAPTQSTQQPTQLQKAKQVSEEQQGQEPKKKPVQAEAAKPVVNTQGQTTGRLLNVTA